MSRRARHNKRHPRCRPGQGHRGPGPSERTKRSLPTPSNQQPKFGTTIYETADKPHELKDDASLTVEILEPPRDLETDPVLLRRRGLPNWLARKFYQRTGQLMDDPELTQSGQKQLAQAVNMIAKVDVETARFQLGEAAATQVNVNQVQVNPAEMMKSYLNEVQDRVNAAYPVPPQIDVESTPIDSVQLDPADEIAEAIKAEVPALRDMNGALTKIVKKAMEDKKKPLNGEG